MNNLSKYTFNAVYLNNEKIIDISNTDTSPDEVDAGNVYYSADGTPTVGTKDATAMQSNWIETDSSSISFIKNKIPLRNNNLDSIIKDSIIHVDSTSGDQILAGSATKTYSSRSISLNEKTIAGAYAFNISAIDKSNYRIYICDENYEISVSDLPSLEGPTERISAKYPTPPSVGNSRLFISIKLNDGSYFTTITTVRTFESNNKYYYFTIPSETKLPSDGNYSNGGFCILIDHPDIGLKTEYAESSAAFGIETKALGPGSLNSGYRNVILSHYGISGGEGNIITGYAGCSFGSENESQGYYSGSFGYRSISSGEAALAVNHSTAKGKYAFSSGNNTFSNGEATATFGIGTKANADYSASFGKETEADGEASLTSGIGTYTNKEAQVAIGKYNKFTRNDSAIYAFMIGWGTSDSNRQNIFDITTFGDGKFYRDLSIVKDCYIGDKLTVTNNTELKSTLKTIGAATFENNLTVKGNTFLENSAEITGAATLKSTLNVNDNATLDKNLTVSKIANIQQLNVNGDTTLGTLETTKTNIIGSLNVTGTVYSSGDVDLDNNLSVKNNTNLYGNLTVYGQSIFDSGVEINGNTVLGTDSSNTVSIKGSLSTDFNTDISGNLTVTGNSSFTNVNSDNIVTDNITVNEDLIVSGNSEFNTIEVSSNAIISDLSVTNSIDVSKDAEITGDLTVSGDSNFKNTSIDGYAEISGLVTSGTGKIGNNLTAQKQTLLVGKYNETNTAKLLNGEENAIFTVGKGTSATSTANAFSVSNSGIHVNGAIYVNGSIINTDNTQADWEEEDDNHPGFIKNKPDIAAAQVQADWDEELPESKAFIKNKPDSIKNPYSLTLKGNGTTLKIYDGSQDKDTEVNFTWENVGAAKNEHKHYMREILDYEAPEPPEQVQANWNETNTSSKAYINNKPDINTMINNAIATVPAQVQSNWTESDSSSKAYIQNKPSISETDNKITLGKKTITLTDGEDSVTFSVADIRKLLSLLNNNEALITSLASTYNAETDTITFSDGTDTTESEIYN